MELGRAGLDERRQGDAEASEAGGDAPGGALQESLDDHDPVERGAAGSSEVLGESDAEDACCGGARVEVAREGAGLFPGVDVGANLTGRPAGDGIAEGEVLLGKKGVEEGHRRRWKRGRTAGITSC